MAGLVLDAAETLFPGYFALVMATGAMSIAAHLLGMTVVPRALLAFNAVAFCLLWSLTLIRLWRFTGRMASDFVDHAKGPGFFTLIAGTCMFGAEAMLVGGMPEVAHLLWIAGILLWFAVMYGFFTAVTVRTEKPDLEHGLNGTWLIAAVATHSIAVLGAMLAGRLAEPAIVLFFSLCMYLLGCMLYLSIITLIFYRFAFVRLTSAALTPPYWINMGAVAITTLAGATLILQAPRWPFLAELAPFLKGFTLFFWSAATWWIPLLLVLTVWRHLVCRQPLRYEPQFWGMAFPLAMYTTGTIKLAQALDLPFLLHIPEWFVYIALAVWVAIAAGMVSHLYERIRLHVRAERAKRASAG